MENFKQILSKLSVIFLLFYCILLLLYYQVY